MIKPRVEYEITVRRLTTEEVTKREWQKKSDTEGEEQYGYGPEVTKVETRADEVFKRRAKTLNLDALARLLASR